MTAFIAGLLFAAAQAVPLRVAQRLSSEEWADLIDGEVWLLRIAVGEGS